MTVKEAAERIGVDPHTIRNWISQGMLEGARFGPRLIRVDPASLEKFGRPLQYVAPESGL
ncbi:excisionase family DNA-binding protein [Diaminobutyricibacter sp. McL0618]|uniref:excisionase family DNA-binding protein n=1 Tax=Leifsonia sp. McL0618 TaxID=3415677 RepID=UPI003CF7692A